MTFGAEYWGAPLISGIASLFGAKSQAPQETKMQKTQRKLVDQLLSSLNGNGPYSDLYNADENTFQKSFVEPAQSRFRNQIAPQIQQEYIASGQQRGTGLDDQLLRAGVDMDALLNQQMYNFQQDALNRKQGSINSILGQGPGAANETTGFQNVLGGLGGYLTSPSFSNQFANLFSPSKSTSTFPIPQRKGFEPTFGGQNVFS